MMPPLDNFSFTSLVKMTVSMLATLTSVVPCITDSGHLEGELVILLAELSNHVLTLALPAESLGQRLLLALQVRDSHTSITGGGCSGHLGSSFAVF
jgi:hypothetical protein